MDKVLHTIEGVGECGIDTEASPGNGQYFVRAFNISYDAVGFDTLEEAIEELKYLGGEFV